MAEGVGFIQPREARARGDFIPVFQCWKCRDDEGTLFMVMHCDGQSSRFRPNFVSRPKKNFSTVRPTKGWDRLPGGVAKFPLNGNMQDLAWQCPRSHNLRPCFQHSLAQLLSLVLAKLGFPSVFVSFSYSKLLETQRGSVFTRLSLTSALSFLLRRYSSAVATAGSKRASLASCQLCPCKAAVYSTDTIATPPVLAYISLLREVELHQC